MLWELAPSLKDPSTGLESPEAMRSTSRKTGPSAAAAMSSLPSCVNAKPVGGDLSGTTRSRSVRPSARSRSAMPGFLPELSPISETKTRQPSADGLTAKGREGRAMVTDREAAGALQPDGWADAARAESAISARSQQRRWPRYLGWRMAAGRSEERRVGKECRSRWSPY